MDNSFSLHRIGLLMKRQWASFGKIFLIALGAVTLVILGFYLYYWPSIKNISIYGFSREGIVSFSFPIPVFCIIGILFVSLSSSWYFSKWGKKASAMEELILPVSNLEKAVCGILFTSIVCIGSFLIVFLLIDGGYRMYLNDFVKTLDPKMTISVTTENDSYVNHMRDCHAESFVKEIGSLPFVWTIVIGFILQGLFLLGSIYFKRFQYIKTLLAVSITTFIAVYLAVKWTISIEMDKHRVYHTLQDLENQNGNVVPVFWYVFVIVVILVCYWVTYLRIKEKEI